MITRSFPGGKSRNQCVYNLKLAGMMLVPVAVARSLRTVMVRMYRDKLKLIKNAEE
jgi:hypothetical protein